MDYITLKQYAESKHVTYEAVRKQIVRYQDELKGHIIKHGRTQCIDEWAVAFLSERRRESPIVVTTEDQRDKIEELTAELESMKAKMMSAQNELLSAKNKIIELQSEQRQFIESQLKYTALLEDHAAQTKQLREMELQLITANAQHDEDQKQLDELRIERDEAVTEANSYQKSFFGFYRKRTT